MLAGFLPAGSCLNMADYADFVGDAYTAPSITQDAQETINFYPEIDPAKNQGSRGVIALYPTPGMKFARQRNVSGNVRALFALPTTSNFYLGGTGVGLLLTVIGSSVDIMTIPFGQTVPTGTSSLGFLNTTDGPLDITCNGQYVLITDGVSRYSIDLNAPTVVVLTDGPWTGGVSCDVVDGYIVYNQGGSKQWAATNNLSTATAALSFASSLSSYDGLVALFVDNRQVALIGQQTTEFWAAAALVPFPFAISPGTTRQFGCAAAYTVSRFANGFMMLSQDQQGVNIVALVVNYEMKRVSTHAVEQSLVGKFMGDAYAFTYQLEGHVFYVLQCPSAGVTWVYDLATGMWHKRTSTDTNGLQKPWRASCSASLFGQVFVGSSDDNSVYYLSNSYAVDDVGSNGANRFIRRLRRGPHITKNLKRQFFKEIQFQFQPGIGLTSGQGVDPQIMVRWSDDGGFTWSNEHFVSVGAQGQYQWRAIVRRMGYARDRVYEVAVTDPVYWALISVEIDIDDGSN